MNQVHSTDSAGLLDRLRKCLPGSCLVCGFPVRRVISLCEDCENRLPRVRLCCGVCGIPLSTSGSTSICGRCLLKPPPFTLCRGVFHYRSPISNLLARFKYHGHFASGRALAWQLAQRLIDYYETIEAMSGSVQLPQLLIPVPLHKRRLRERGFNQAALISKVITQRTAIPMANHLLIRTRHTEAQSRLHAINRAVNLNNAFSAVELLPAAASRRVAVIDDVVTTTATASAVSRALLAAGAERVDIWAIARA